MYRTGKELGREFCEGVGEDGGCHKPPGTSSGRAGLNIEECEV